MSKRRHKLNYKPKRFTRPEPEWDKFEDMTFDDDVESSESDPTAWDDTEQQFNIRDIDPTFIDESGRPNKSKLKRYAAELQALGETLIALPQLDFDALPLPDKLRDAVLIARRITKHGGLYRQKQYIGKLMRKFDTAPIHAILQAKQEAQRSAAREFHRIERWRNRLIDEPQALSEFLDLLPSIDRQQLTNLVEQAQQERQRGNQGAARELFGFVRDAFSQPVPSTESPKPATQSAIRSATQPATKRAKPVKARKSLSKKPARKKVAGRKGAPTKGSSKPAAKKAFKKTSKKSAKKTSRRAAK